MSRTMPASARIPSCNTSHAAFCHVSQNLFRESLSALSWAQCPFPPLQHTLFVVHRTRRPRSAWHSVSVSAACMMASPLSAPRPRLTAGTVLEYTTPGGRRRLATVVKPDGKRNWIVIDRNGITQSVAPKQVSYVVRNAPVASSLSESPVAVELNGNVAVVVSELEVLERECEERVTQSAELLELAWEIVSERPDEEGGRTASLQELSELVFDGATEEDLFATHVLLARDRTFFKGKFVKKQAVYEARSAGLVEEAKQQVKAEEHKARAESALNEIIVASMESGDMSQLRSTLGQVETERILHGLETVAEKYGSDDKYQSDSVGKETGLGALETEVCKSTMRIFHAIGKPAVPQTAFNILVQWGIFHKHENLELRRLQLHHNFVFTEDLLDIANNIRNGAEIADLDAEYRKDLTHLLSYAVDSADTVEIDDAISWDPEDEKVWVHIADPLRFCPEGLSNALVAEALRRGTTTYLPTEKLTMFPSAVAAHKFSLGGLKADGTALSFGFQVDEDGAITENSAIIAASRIAPPIQMTYESVDAFLATAEAEEEGNHPVVQMMRIANLRRNFRRQDGAVLTNNPFSRIHVSDPGSDEPTISVGTADTGTPSWTLVSEMMITACAIAGDFGEKHDLALPFRGQRSFMYPSDDTLQDIPEGPARNAIIFKEAPPSEVRSEPIEHASLALDSYVQVTSPIRRGMDLVAHLQIKAQLRGDTAPLDVATMDREIARSNDATRISRQLDQKTTKYWHFEYLRRLGPRVAHEGIYVRSVGDLDNRVGLVQLKESAFQLVAQIPTGTKLGQDVCVRVVSVDPRALTCNAVATVRLTDTVNKEEEDTVLLEDTFSDIVEDELFP